MKKRERGDIVKVSDLFETYKKRLHAPQGTVIKTFKEVASDLLARVELNIWIVQFPPTQIKTNQAL